MEKNRQIDQWNKRESPDLDLCRYHQLVFDKKANAYNEEKINGPGTTGQPHAKKEKKNKSIDTGLKTLHKFSKMAAGRTAMRERV